MRRSRRVGLVSSERTWCRAEEFRGGAGRIAGSVKPAPAHQGWGRGMASAAEQLAANLNFGTFAKATELKKRIWFTLLALIVYRIGCYIPLPGIHPHALSQMFQRQSGGILDMFNMFSGGALQRMTIFALNIMPY